MASAGVEQGRSGMNEGSSISGGGGSGEEWKKPTIHCIYPKCARKQAVYHPGGVCEASIIK